MATKIIGKDSLFGIKKGTTWRTAVACDADDGVLLNSEGVMKDQETLEDDPAGQAWDEDVDLGKITVSGDIPAYFRYELDVIIALAMGIAGTPTDVSGGTTYSNLYKPSDDLDGLFATFAIYKAAYVSEIPSVKIHGFSISGEAGQPITITFHVKGNNKNMNSAVNTKATMTENVTLPTKQRIMWSHLKFRMNDMTGDALDDDDRIYPVAWAFDYTRSLAEDVAGGNNEIIEPCDDGKPKVTLGITMPRVTTVDYITDFEAETLKKVDIIAIGPTIPSTSYSYKMWMEFPKLAFSAHPTDGVESSAKVQQELNFYCLKPTASEVPSGMTGCTYPFWMYVQNGMTSDPLA